MDLVGPEGKTGAFSSSNEPRESKPHFADFCTSVKTLIMEPVGPEGQKQKFSWTFVKALVMEPVGPKGKMSAFSSSNKPPIRVNPYFDDLYVLSSMDFW
ncbi:hypothetical protein H5410_062186 [Solanum commersonii]|uniref:Uncharacterized protein n=1 Tax=Solanum commersonii TaxID=4109 RepID=A0A9J5WAV6_SOLCO|nr:hypothetical protein H5410_062186 [Solanum commersonii]